MYGRAKALGKKNVEVDPSAVSYSSPVGEGPEDLPCTRAAGTTSVSETPAFKKNKCVMTLFCH